MPSTQVPQARHFSSYQHFPVDADKGGVDRRQYGNFGKPLGQELDTGAAGHGDERVVFIHHAIQFLEKFHVALPLHRDATNFDGITFHATGDLQFGVQHPDLLLAACQAYRHAGAAPHGEDFFEVFHHGSDLFNGLSFRNNHLTFLLFVMARGCCHAG
ncbi:hypothetical protein [Desulfosarcina cetonica]|uniref:hypothetical protein n=1 Tax=Desulfosarcina cetonica TaxID=90730 RepID=UPI00278BB36D|nr:hypothetical protein [Desulfosarcina cetonica]